MINKRIIAILQEIKEGNEELFFDKKLDSNISLRTDLGFDSFDLALLTAKIEDEFGIDIFEDGVIDKVEDILKLLEKK